MILLPTAERFSAFAVFRPSLGLLLQPHANPSTCIVVQKENPQSLAFAVGLLLPRAQQKTMFGKA